jgi:superoxide dismutase, Cu-Zn family
MHPLKTLSILAAALLAAGSARAAEPAKPLLAKAELKDASGKKVGDVSLEQTPNGVLVFADLTGLPPGVHAMHIHEAAKCEPPFKTAGGHFNPGAKEHGMKNMKGMHAGDLPNVEVPKEGALKVQALVQGVSLGEGPTSLFGKSGTSIVIHAGVDDYATNPAGNAGDRIACGVVEKK